MKSFDAKIEYLEGTGTQYIDTGIIPTANTGIRIEAERTSDNLDLYILGLRNDSGNTRWCLGNANRYFWGYGTWSGDYTRTRHVVLDLNYNNDKKYYLRNYYTLSSVYSESLPSLSFVPAYSIYLFWTNGYGRLANYGKWQGKLYSVKITEGTSVVMDLIPVRKGQVGYMYDKVSGRIFGNSGSGNFTLGPDK